MATQPPASPPGWYPDPYRAGWRRWFDGSIWTTHAVPSDRPDPDDLVERDFDPRSDTQLRQDEWLDGFPKWDVAVHRGSEPPFNGGGGVGGLEANRAARLSSRYQDRLPSVVGWLVAVTVAVALLAWADSRHRLVLAAAAAALFVATLCAAVHRARVQRHWEDVGRDP